MADFKHLVRIANTDLDGKKAIVYALKDVRGVGVPLAIGICYALKLDGLSKIGELSDAQIAKLEEASKEPGKFGIPSWMFNRQRDSESGEDKHLVSNDLIFQKENDIKALKKIKCYRGVRHMHGDPVRGQRTRSNFRKNKGKVMGVKTSGKKSGGK